MPSQPISRPKSAWSGPAPDDVLTVLQISSKSVHLRRSYSRTRETRFWPRRVFPLFRYRFRTCQGPCRANLHKWGLAQSPSCDCGQRQTMNHIVDTCPLTKFEGGLNLLHEADDVAVIWVESTATAALAK